MTHPLGILCLGAGELGTAIAHSLLTHSAWTPSNSTQARNSLTIAIRPTSYHTLRKSLADQHSPSSTSQSESKRPLDNKTKGLLDFHSQGARFRPADLTQLDEPRLEELFSGYDTIIHCGGMDLPAGIQLKITRAVLNAAAKNPSKSKTYIPWQWGLDYDKIGNSAGNGLFAEQIQVRDLLRGQTVVEWFIVSCGMFMSFLFEDFWGIIQRKKKGKVDKTRALRSWDHRVTVTDVDDLGTVTAHLLLVDQKNRGGPIYVAGDSVTYSQLADMVDRAVSRPVERELWSLDMIQDQSKKYPEDKLWSYREVFAGDRGVNWDVKGSYNDQQGLQSKKVEDHIRDLRLV